MKEPNTDKHSLQHGGARFFFVNGPKAGRETLITRDTFFIGRSHNNNLVIDDRSVSRKHAVLNFTDGQYILSDLNSFKGTFVNEQKIKEAVISNGDTVTVGGAILKFITEGSYSVPKKRGMAIWLAGVILLAGFSAVWLIFRSGGGKNETAKRIEFYYSQGVKCYNFDKDISCAKINWKKVLELDPAGQTEHARKARVLLGNLPSNGGGAESR